MRKFKILLLSAALTGGILTACSDDKECWTCRGMGHIITSDGEKVECHVCKGKGRT
ncbi:MAG: hypothetical protein LBH98_07035 [Chitinispirillales bacterium]|jgi:DnaJ-class molecular chaperone|nr:hypothetical protein [Chitinispirillales bacterium]